MKNSQLTSATLRAYRDRGTVSAREFPPTSAHLLTDRYVDTYAFTWFLKGHCHDYFKEAGGVD